MDKEKLNQKILKIQELVRRGGTHGERAAAKKMLDKLVEQYDLDLEEMEEQVVRKFAYNRQGRHIALHVAFHMGLQIFDTQGFAFQIKANATEWELFKKLYEFLQKTYDRKRAEMISKLKDEMKGYMDSAYPTKDPVCESCESPKIFYDNGYVVCPACGFKRKIRYSNHDIESYGKGKKAGVKSLPGK